jgi:hypothetical protein
MQDAKGMGSQVLMFESGHLRSSSRASLTDGLRSIAEGLALQLPIFS